MEDRVLDAYAAGLIDGEGTVTLSRLHANANRAPVVSFASTSKELVAFFTSTYGGKVITKTPRHSEHSLSWEWRITQDAALSFLRRLQPYLRHEVKRYRTALLITEYKSVTKRNGKYTPTTLVKKREFEHRFFHPSMPWLTL